MNLVFLDLDFHQEVKGHFLLDGLWPHSGYGVVQIPLEGESQHLVIKLITSFLVQLISSHYHRPRGGKSGV